MVHAYILKEMMKTKITCIVGVYVDDILLEGIDDKIENTKKILN